MSFEENFTICRSCKKPLSIFPIFSVTKRYWNICGRWGCRKHVCTYKTRRNKTLEDLSKTNLFPCGYKKSGCGETLSPSEMEQHEECCEHGFWGENICKTLFPQLTQYRSIALTLRSLSKHSLGTTSQLDIFTNKKVFTINKNSWEFFIVTTPQTEKFAVFTTLKYSKNETLFLIKMINVHENIRNSTHFISYIIHSDLEKTPLRLCTTNVISLKLKTEWFQYRLEILKVEQTISTQCQTVMNTIYAENSFLSSLKCPRCLTFMTSKIRYCPSGHSFCGHCYKYLLLCSIPFCKSILFNPSQLNNIQNENFALENVVKFVRFPCKNAKKGCTFVDRLEYLLPHRKECIIGDQKCILRDHVKCYWNGTRGELLRHIKEEHRSHIIQSKKISIIIDDNFFGEVHKTGYVLLPKDGNCERVVLLIFSYENETFYWGLESVDQSQKWLFAVDIVDDNGDNQYKLLGEDCRVGAHSISLKLQEVKFLIKNRFNFFINIVSKNSVYINI